MADPTWPEPQKIDPTWPGPITSTLMENEMFTWSMRALGISLKEEIWPLWKCIFVVVGVLLQIGI